MHSLAACTAASLACSLASDVSYWFGRPLSLSQAARYTSIRADSCSRAISAICACTIW